MYKGLSLRVLLATVEILLKQNDIDIPGVYTQLWLRCVITVEK